MLVERKLFANVEMDVPRSSHAALLPGGSAKWRDDPAFVVTFFFEATRYCFALSRLMGSRGKPTVE